MTGVGIAITTVRLDYSIFLVFCYFLARVLIHESYIIRLLYSVTEYLLFYPKLRHNLKLILPTISHPAYPLRYSYSERYLYKETGHIAAVELLLFRSSPRPWIHGR